MFFDIAILKANLDFAIFDLAFVIIYYRLCIGLD